jgi:hypothetical protein
MTVPNRVTKFEWVSPLAVAECEGEDDANRSDDEDYGGGDHVG